MPPEGDIGRFVVFAQNGRGRFLRPGLPILQRRMSAPFENRFRIGPVSSAQFRGRSLRFPAFVSQSPAS